MKNYEKKYLENCGNMTISFEIIQIKYLTSLDIEDNGLRLNAVKYANLYYILSI